MIDRVCRNCRWYIDKTGGARRAECHRYPRVWTSVGWCLPSPDESSTCGEWADRDTSPEQEDWREMVRRFAVAIVIAGVGEKFANEDVWYMAEKLAVAEPKP